MFNLKLAICIYGQPRYLTNKNVKIRLENILSKYDVEFYIHTWNIDLCVGSEWNNHNSNVVDLFNVINNNYKPKRILIDRELKNHNLEDGIINAIKTKPYYSNHNIISLSSHLYSFQTSLSLIDDVYDFIFITRFDNLLNKFPDLNMLSEGNLYYTNYYNGNFSDASLIISYDMVEKFKPYDDIKTVLPLCDTITSECVKKLSFLSKYKIENMISTDLICSIARSEFDEIGIL